MKCTVRPRRCVLGCHCKLGLLRDVTGKCVTAEQCTDTPQNNATNVTHTLEGSFVSNVKKRQKSKFLLDDDSIEDLREPITNYDNSTNTNNLLKNMNTEQSLPNGRLGVFPPVDEKTSVSRRYFEEVPYTYSKFDTTFKPLFELHTVETNKMSMDSDLKYYTPSSIYKTTSDISRTTDEMTLPNNTLKVPLYSILSDGKLDFLDKTAVKVKSETNFNEQNVTDTANGNTEEQDKKTTPNPSSTYIPTSSANTFPVSKVYLKDDFNPLRLPVALKQYKPYNDVLSKAVKYYKDFTASTPVHPYTIKVPISYKIGDSLHVLFSDNHKGQEKSTKLLKETTPIFTSFTSKAPKDIQHVKTSTVNSNLFSLASNPFIKNRDTKSMKEENMKDTIVSNLLNAMREILPTPVNFTIVNFSK